MGLKPHLVSDGGVAISFEMLTYYKYAPLSNKIDALPSNTTWGFKPIFVLDIKNNLHKTTISKFHYCSYKLIYLGAAGHVVF
jgi:hypothetical protein